MKTKSKKQTTCEHIYIPYIWIQDTSIRVPDFDYARKIYYMICQKCLRTVNTYDAVMDTKKREGSKEVEE